MIWLGLDFETTGLDTKADRVIEVGAILWDPHRKVPLKIFNEMVKVDRDLSPIITNLTGITDEDLDKWGHDSSAIFGQLDHMIRRCDYVVAHNGNSFDKPFYENECERHDLHIIEKPWLDSRLDVPYPDDKSQSKKLSHLAMEHGFLNPFPHRALSDVLTMLKVVSYYDPDSIIEFKNAPNVTVRALVNFDNKDKAKARGYHWEAKKKIWYKTMKQSELNREIEQADFKVIEIGEENESKN